MVLADNYFTNVPKPHNVTASELDQMVNGINANATSISTTHNHNGSNSLKVTMPQVYWMTLHLVAGTAHRAAFLNSFMTPSAAKISVYAKPAVNLTTVSTVVTAQTTTATGTIAAHSMTINNASLSAVANTLPEIAVPAVGNHSHTTPSHGHAFHCEAGVSGSALNWHIGLARLQDSVTAFTVGPSATTGVMDGGSGTSGDAGGHGHTIAAGTGSHGHSIADHNHSITGTQTHSFVGDAHTHTMDTHNHTVTKTLGSSLPTDVTAKVDANVVFTSRNFSSSGDYLNQTIDYTFFAVGDHYVEVTANIDCEVQVCINVKGTIS